LTLLNSLDANQIGTPGGIAFGKTLKENSYITQLHLSNFNE